MKAKLILPVLAVLVAGTAYYVNRPESAAAVQTTNDARIAADFTNVSAQTSGIAAEVLVHRNQRVAKGDLLVLIDPRQHEVAVETATAALAASRANLRTLEGQRDVQAATIAQAEATLTSARAADVFAKTEENRNRTLVERNSSAQRVLDQAVSDLAAADAAVQGADAALRAVQSGLVVLEAEIEAAAASVKQAQAALDDAELQLSHTRIAAPVAGTVGQFNARVGNYVTPGQTLMAIVPLEEIYVEANFRETQLAHVAPGQPVAMRIDAFPGQAFTGTVESIGPASGATYSSVAPQNATGNFTKVAQRLPVRITLSPGQEGLDAIRVGMSVVPEISTR